MRDDAERWRRADPTIWSTWTDTLPNFLQQPLTATMLTSQRRAVPLPASLIYYRRDPLAVTLALSAPKLPDGEARWVFARDLLDDGLRAPSGLRDVAITPVDEGQILIELSTRKGYAALTVDTTAVRTFLQRTYHVVPAGREVTSQDLDVVIGRLLNWG